MLRSSPRACCACCCAAAALAHGASAGKVEVLWLGQSAFKITTPGGKVIVTDPWLLQNPKTPPRVQEAREPSARSTCCSSATATSITSPMRRRWRRCTTCRCARRAT